MDKNILRIYNLFKEDYKNKKIKIIIKNIQVPIIIDLITINLYY